jgi:hypothetical protein
MTLADHEAGRHLIRVMRMLLRHNETPSVVDGSA